MTRRRISSLWWVVVGACSAAGVACGGAPPPVPSQVVQAPEPVAVFSWDDDPRHRVAAWDTSERLSVLSVCRPLRARGEWSGRSGDVEAWMPGLYPTDPVPDGHTVWTFDDGPMGWRTEGLLDVLATADVRAAFFVVGLNIEPSDYGLVQRVVAEGHTLANHGFNHDGYMVAERSGDVTRDYIVWQYAVTQAVVDAALLARDRDDFAALRAAVLGPMSTRPRAVDAAADVPALWQRHQALLDERNAGVSPYPMRWARPPGGAPWFGRWGLASYVAYAEACAALGLINAYWHHQTDDSNPNLTPEERADAGRMRDQLVRASRTGGVLLAHDRIAVNGVRQALWSLGGDERVVFAQLDDLLVAKYGCDATDLGDVVRGHSGWWLPPLEVD